MNKKEEIKIARAEKNQIDRVVENLIAQIETNRDHFWQIELAQI